MNVDPQEFVRELLRYYDPITYHYLFEPATAAAPEVQEHQM